MAKQRSVNDEDGLRQGDRLALEEAERTARVAKATLVAALVLMAGGCSVPVVGVGVLGSGNDGLWLPFLIFGIGLPVAFVGQCVLPAAIAFRVKAKRKFEALNPRSHDHPQDVNEAKWRDLLAASSRWGAVPAPQPTWPSTRRTTRNMNNQNEIPRNVHRALEQVARTGQAPTTLDRAVLPRGVRFALDEAERAAKVAKRALVVTLTLVGGGCSFAAVSARNVGHVDGRDMVGIEWVALGVLVAFGGLCVLPFAIGLQIKAYRMLQRLRKQIDQPSDDHLDGVNPPEWHNSLGTAPLWRKPGDSH